MGRKEWNQTKPLAHGELLWSLDPRRASSTIALKDISLTLDFNQTWQKWTLYGTL